MFRHLLVSLDATPQGGRALPLARAAARSLGAAVTLLQVAPDTGSPFDRTAEITMREQLRELASQLSAEGLEVTGTLTSGSVPAVACKQHCDLVVAASLAAGQVRDAGIPLLLLGPAGHPFIDLRTMLVAVDEAPAGLETLAMAAPLAEVTGARILVAEAVVPSSPTAASNPFASYWEEARLARAGTFVAELATRLVGGGVQAESVARSGEVSATILSIADEREPDLIVISERSSESANQDEIVGAARCPVLTLDRQPAPLNGAWSFPST
jgi:nucleotide-binding universal stress UspA family protein